MEPAPTRHDSRARSQPRSRNYYTASTLDATEPSLKSARKIEVSRTLLWNRKGMIVITNSRNDLNSYLVPEPNVRIKVTDQASVLPAWTLVKGINARGDLIGSAGPSYGVADFDFFLERVDAR